MAINVLSLVLILLLVDIEKDAEARRKRMRRQDEGCRRRINVLERQHLKPVTRTKCRAYSQERCRVDTVQTERRHSAQAAKETTDRRIVCMGASQRELTQRRQWDARRRPFGCIHLLRGD
ncbi:hypothetical protein HD554DRAFT_1531681 [Boletus coccyginus]|nr:hypothetical protein HD554DRAFT_1531681 [Boletus coccyginus]